MVDYDDGDDSSEDDLDDEDSDGRNPPAGFTAPLHNSRGPALPPLSLPGRHDVPRGDARRPQEEFHCDEEAEYAAPTARGRSGFSSAMPPMRPGSQEPMPPTGPPGQEELEARPRVRPPQAPGVERLGSSMPELRVSKDVSDDERHREGEDDREHSSGEEDTEGRQDQQELGSPAYPSYSWRETLSRFPSLLRLYPLAASSETHLDQPKAEQPEDGTGSGSAAVGIDELEGNEEYLNSIPSASSQVLGQRPEPRGPATPISMHSAHISHPGSPARSVQRGYAEQRRSQGPTPMSPLSSRASPCPHKKRWVDPGTAAAWTEVEAARRDIEQRERDLELREAMVCRAEARNDATARQLGELRCRLDEYGLELEEGVLALTAQQEALREERRQTLELQVRARRFCSARDDPKARIWPRRPRAP